MAFELCYHINSILNNKEYDRNRIVHANKEYAGIV